MDVVSDVSEERAAGRVADVASHLVEAQKPALVEPFSAALFRALAQAASSSTRNQADVLAALSRANLIYDRHSLALGLDLLRDEEVIDKLIPLEDGGLLVSLTMRGVKRARDLGLGGLPARRNR